MAKIHKLICDCGSEEFHTTEDKSSWWNDVRTENIVLLNSRCLKCNLIFLVKMNRKDYES